MGLNLNSRTQERARGGETSGRRQPGNLSGKQETQEDRKEGRGGENFNIQQEI